MARMELDEVAHLNDEPVARVGSRFLPVPAALLPPLSGTEPGMIDVAVPRGTPVYSVEAGRVVQASGATVGEVVVRGENGTRFHYRRLMPSSVAVAEGDAVDAGAVLGLVAASVNASTLAFGIQAVDGNWKVAGDELVGLADPSELFLLPPRAGDAGLVAELPSQRRPARSARSTAATPPQPRLSVVRPEPAPEIHARQPAPPPPTPKQPAAEPAAPAAPAADVPAPAPAAPAPAAPVSAPATDPASDAGPQPASPPAAETRPSGAEASAVDRLTRPRRRPGATPPPAADTPPPPAPEPEPAPPAASASEPPAPEPASADPAPITPEASPSSAPEPESEPPPEPAPTESNEPTTVVMEPAPVSEPEAADAPAPTPDDARVNALVGRRRRPRGS